MALATVAELLERDRPVSKTTNIRHDVTHDSSLELNRKVFNEAIKHKVDHKHYKHAVVISVFYPGEETAIYSNGIHDAAYLCDVFLHEQDRLTEGSGSDIKFLSDTDLDDLAMTHNYKLFYPIGKEVSDQELDIGDVVVVKEADTYPAHVDILQTRYDNKIISKTGLKLTVTDLSGKQVAQGGQGSSSLEKNKGSSSGFGKIGNEQLVMKILEKAGVGKQNYYKVNFAPSFNPKEVKEEAYIMLNRVFDPKNTKPLAYSSLPGSFRTIDLPDRKNVPDLHGGLDLPIPQGTDLYNIVPFGRITFYGGLNGAGGESSAGNSVHVGIFNSKEDADKNVNMIGTLLYMHLSDIDDTLQIGQLVGIGNHLGKTGGAKGVRGSGSSTGPHLHLEMTVSGKTANWFYITRGNLKGSLGDVNIPVDPKELIVYKVDESSDRAIVQKGEKFQMFSNLKTNPTAVTDSPPASFPRLLITDFTVDLSMNNKNKLQQGVINIKIREDLRSKLLKVKNILNNFGIPLTLEYFDFDINQSVSYLAKIGAEIKLNKFSSLNYENNPKLFNDYYVSPIRTKRIYNNGYLLDIYAKVNSSVLSQDGYYAQYKELEYYDIRETYKKTEPKTLIEKDYFVNISDIFRSNGFFPTEPKYEFFKYSIPDDSWNIFQSFDKLKENKTTLENSLKLIYDKNKTNSPVWIDADKIIWNGKRFV